MPPNTPEGGRPREFMKVLGFTNARDLKMSPANIADYENKGMDVPKPGEFCQNNGVIAAATTGGEIVVWIPKSDPNAPREVPYEQAIQNLKNNGYVEGSFGVPS